MNKSLITALILLTCSLSLASERLEPGHSRPTDQPPAPTAEVLKGFLSDHQTVTFQVKSNGCTNKDNFELSILESHPAIVELVRTKDDWCRTHLPYGTTVEYTYQEIGLNYPNSFYIINKIETGLLPKK